MSIISEEYIQRAIANALQDEKCEQIHLGQTCNQVAFAQFSNTLKSAYKMYFIVHLIPFLIFKRKRVKERPFHQIKKLIIGFIKSMLFAGFYSGITRRVICIVAKLYKFTSINLPIGAVVAGVALLLESKSRQTQIALYCMNKTIQSTYNMAIRRRLPVTIPYGECLIASLSIGIISFHFINCPQAIRSSYLFIINKLVGQF